LDDNSVGARLFDKYFEFYWAVIEKYINKYFEMEAIAANKKQPKWLLWFLALTDG